MSSHEPLPLLSGQVFAAPDPGLSEPDLSDPDGHESGLPDPALPILDVRDRTAFVAGHIASATHIPFADLTLRRHELPAPGTPLQLLADSEALLQAAMLQLAGWQYAVRGSFLLNETLRLRAQAAQRWQRGYFSQRLWQPSQTLALALPMPSVQAVLAATPAMGAPRRALDLACGSGRDALFLAVHGFQVTAVDVKPDALQRLAISASAAELAMDIECHDLEQAPPPWQADRFDLINVARYLHRPLLPLLARWLRPGGVLAYETFLRGAEQFGGPRRPQFLLERGELVSHFSGWTILHAAEQTLADGRPVQQFVARKPA